jgi:hypothetical protein
LQAFLTIAHTIAHPLIHVPTPLPTTQRRSDRQGSCEQTRRVKTVVDEMHGLARQALSTVGARLEVGPPRMVVRKP